MTELCTEFTNIVARQQLFAPGDKLLLGVSGGIDSMVLTALCAEAGLNFEIAHANFQLRGEASDLDEELVAGMSEKYGVKCHSRKFDTFAYASEKKIAVQQAARELRYQWFASFLLSEDDPDSASTRAKYIVTAHHRDDNIETVLFNYFRGTGISGLRGILPKQNRIIRPLLLISKARLQKYAEQNSLEWREDESNQSSKYSRNFIRNRILPLITEIIPEIDRNIGHNIQRMMETEELYQQAIKMHRRKLLKQSGSEFQIPINALLAKRPVHSILYELAKPFGFSAHQVPELMKLTRSEQGSFVDADSYRIIRNRNILIITPKENKESGLVLIGSNEGTHVLPNPYQSLSISLNPIKDVVITGREDVANMDSGKLDFPLIFRRWKQGDYFYPLGMSKKKKVGRFLIDLKLSPTAKQNIHVLQSGNRICWVVGLRIDERFRITDKTTTVITLKVI
ncbi:MAG TPA: tRNA lysidine(34) synthetase TilS [Flavitalea sp.]|nr:tRNA lysidine(34) synthetase TilS [Flavitalea sp.]